MALNYKVRIREFPESRYKEIDGLVDVMLKQKRSGKPLIFNTRIKEFITEEALPAMVDQYRFRIYPRPHTIVPSRWP